MHYLDVKCSNILFPHFIFMIDTNKIKHKINQTEQIDKIDKIDKTYKIDQVDELIEINHVDQPTTYIKYNKIHGCDYETFMIETGYIAYDDYHINRNKNTLYIHMNNEFINIIKFINNIVTDAYIGPMDIEENVIKCIVNMDLRTSSGIQPVQTVQTVHTSRSNSILTYGTFVYEKTDTDITPVNIKSMPDNDMIEINVVLKFAMIFDTKYKIIPVVESLIYKNKFDENRLNILDMPIEFIKNYCVEI
ncbi:MAG: hypothetical protein Terrestrivirus4_209 [Terrestrivirus sp.]|uniref:Uncharacterized protein n=1 Tax=Terrestrivirus sp. TaxID=2487775 RepID=A0A3G4ZQA1_9VIRU|nr:MAG: hypothetical protein Terrestrivirus4_209 [Terrestrivirus sp.]